MWTFVSQICTEACVNRTFKSSMTWQTELQPSVLLRLVLDNSVGCSVECLQIWTSWYYSERSGRMFIYLIVNHVTGKYYVGQHKGRNLQRYLGQKLSGARAGLYPNTYLFRSMRKHHKEAWSIHALLSDIQTKQELDQYECDFIAFLRARDPDFGYNICRGGEGFTGPHSAEARRKNSEASRRMWQQPGHRKLFSSIMTGHPTSKETIDKIRAARLLQDESERL